MHKIDHIGIAVKSLVEAVPAWESLLGINASGTEEVPSERVRVAFFGDGPGRVELLEATEPDSPIARHIEKRGPGIHHVCLRVANLEAALDRAAKAGLTPIPPGIRDGSGGHRVAFLHPRETGGVLLELTEEPDG
ncbi:MAG: methylmalonyl-CoA epimerase [marine benthic group bacterium]|nr:methylmalonyl-CoA epimerase [Gemmatimonadota bacterium]MCL7962989.1 methylmalonyl-CoA epimerase [Candidatus Carthagonibacter metallireducens]MCL7938598.1 methylmalonyl-CoA epimerase [Gemmatimonadota bacterium]MCL7967731.1 methylmalonyl-CoA epimerase [Gemmatimonadota bacterium]MCL7977378.1 methylmalonyl-CoA epimerase [Gemmatimonadota bacterium]